MLIQDEKRGHTRLTMGSEASFSCKDSDRKEACTLIELSATGLSLVSAHKVDPGVYLTITAIPVKSITPPLVVEAKVLRVKEAFDLGYEIACQILKIIEQ